MVLVQDRPFLLWTRGRVTIAENARCKGKEPLPSGQITQCALQFDPESTDQVQELCRVPVPSSDDHGPGMERHAKGPKFAKESIRGGVPNSCWRARLKFLGGPLCLLASQRNDQRFYNLFEVSVFQPDRLLVVAGIEEDRLVLLQSKVHIDR